MKGPTLRLTAAYRGGFETRPGWWITFNPGAEGFRDGIELLKKTVPWGERSYDETTHQWWISEQWAATITSLIPALEAHLRQKAML